MVPPPFLLLREQNQEPLARKGLNPSKNKTSKRET